MAENRMRAPSWGREGTDVDVVVIGAGFAGLYMVHRLVSLGLAVRGFEAGSDVGGTWFWNRYPGARCDIESLEYSYSFSPEIQRDWTWSARYAEQAEIRRYLEYVADRLDLRRHFTFNARIAAQRWNDRSSVWEVESQEGVRTNARFCVMATGNLSTPRVPDIAGLQRFEGDWYHSARWPEAGADFSGQRVAIIGTGSTGIQIIPQVAAQAEHLYVLQRTPNFSVPAQNAPADPDRTEAYKADITGRRMRARQTPMGVSDIPAPSIGALEVSAEERDAEYERLWQIGGSNRFMAAYKDLLTNAEANATAADFVRRKIREIVKAPATAELLCPTDHPIGTKRPCVDTAYYETFNRDNVTLVDVRRAPIQEITRRGIRTANAEYRVDAIVFATGFDAMTGALREIDIRGRNGVTLSDTWSAGPVTYLGLMVHGFPNMFLVTGPGSPSVKSNMVCSIEQHIEWIADCLAHMMRTKADVIEPEPSAQSDWVSYVNEVADSTLMPLADTWYNGSNIPGKPRVFMPYVGGLNEFIRICDEVVADGYRGFEFGSSNSPDTNLDGVPVAVGERLFRSAATASS